MTTPTTLDLAPRQTLRLRRTGALHLQVMQGRVWVTTSGSPADHFVAPGQTLQVPAHADCVIECDSPQAARLRLLTPGATAGSGAPQWPAWPIRPRPPQRS